MHFSFLSCILDAQCMTFSLFWESSVFYSNAVHWCHWAVHGLWCSELMQLRREDSGKTEKCMLSLTQNFQEKIRLLTAMCLFWMKAEFITMLIIKSWSGMWHCIVFMVGTSAANEPAASYLRVEAGRSSILWNHST